MVETAQDGVEGLDKAMEQAFDLILLDLALPLKDGFDVCRDLRQAGIATPILMLTARTQTSDKVVGLKLGADDYVTKPFSSAELLARIEALLPGRPRVWSCPARFASYGGHSRRETGLFNGSRVPASSIPDGEGR